MAAGSVVATVVAAAGCLEAGAPIEGPLPGRQAAAANLVATIVAGPDTVTISTGFTIVTTEFTNPGDVLIAAGWEMTISSVSDVGTVDELRSVVADFDLAPGDTVTRVDTLSAFAVASGVGTLRVIGDAANDVPEADETDNSDDWPVAFTFSGGYGQIWGILSNAPTDTLALLRFESNPNDAILITAFPDRLGVGSSPVDPSLRLASATNPGVGGNNDGLNVDLADDGDDQLGTRSVVGGEIMAIRAGAEAEWNQLYIGAEGGTAGEALVVIQNCFRMDAGYGEVVKDSIIESDCMLFPNPVSGVRTRAVLVDLAATAGDNFSLSLESPTLNTVLLAFGPDGTLLGSDDDGGSGTNSSLDVSATADGSHLVLVTGSALLSQGDWTLSITGPGGAAPESGTPRRPITRHTRSPQPKLEIATLAR